MSAPIKLPEKYYNKSTPALLELKIAMESRMDEIREQLSQARAKARDESELISEPWYQRATKARRLYGRDIQRILLELARRNEKRRQDGESLGDHFISVARRRMDPGFFRNLMTEAQEECHVE